ncbi:hypothetical protein ACLKA6_007637 [Drosophila palustris]
MDVDECFYDELSSFISSPSDYSLNHHDFDEIISSTVSPLDSSLDLNAIISNDRETSLQGDSFFSDLFQTTVGHNDLELNFNNLTANLNADKTFSTPPVIGGLESSNELLSICNDNTEIEKLTFGNLLAHTQDRNTPSPTESWGSSSGSSTSGVHSDISDAWQQRQQDKIDIESSMLNVPQLSTVPFVQQFSIKNDSNNDSIQRSIQMPVQVLSASVPNHQQIIEPIPRFPTAEQKVPIVSAVGIIPSKVEAASTTLKPPPSAESIGKTKTIFLSSNDYKALMQKMNLHGSKGAKINGSVKTQIPKIVVKTGNAVRTANLNNPNSPPNLLKNQISTLNRDTPTSIREPDSSSYKCRNIIDEKMYKRQQRMIKNRESASLSRKKKKEYVVSLETRINNLEKENYTLKGENVSLRNQLVAFAKTCKCRKGSACEFVLHSLNSTSKSEQHVKIAPRPASKSFKQHMNAATVKKNVAVLFAMAFMVTLNAGNFHSYLSKQNLDGENAAVADSNVNEPISTGRQLLWVESEEEYNEKLNRSNRQVSEELVVPPLHFLRPITGRGNNATKREDWNSTVAVRYKGRDDPPPLTYPSPSNCTTNSNGNQSEYSRLSLNLQKLINVSGYLNLSKHTAFDIGRDNHEHDFKFSTDYLDLPDMKRPTANLGKRKAFDGYKERLSDIEHKQRKLDTMDKQTHGNKNTSEPTNLFNGIKRQDDTFYVLSFNTEHILVSPTTHNKSARPKISLLLPTAEPSHNGDMMMMQVDCEVFNTKELELKSDMIPAKLRPNVTKWQMKPKHAIINNNNKTQASIKLQDGTVKHEKPRVRTYFMVGPKNQAAAAVSQEKPRFVEFNSSRTLASDSFDSRLHG